MRRPQVLTIALPNKGRLADRALELFEKAGLPARMRGDRALQASLGHDYRAIFVRAADVPEYVADGAADVGVTGADLVAERDRAVRELLDLEYGRCRLVVAVRDESEVAAVSDLPDGARVATSFPALTRRYFEEMGVVVELAPVSGAVEVAPHLGVADVVVDLTATGSTLRVNGLREIATVMESSARLVAADEVVRDPDREREIARLVVALESVIHAQQKRYLMANVPRNRLDAVRSVIPGLSGPTIVDVLDSDEWVAAHAVVDADEVYITIARLKELGAEGILVTRIERLML
jgi:ATP phosphoribosyltransferase